MVPSRDGPRVTIQTARVLSALLQGPTEDHYGLDLIRRSGLPSGSLYPTLRRLEQAGWITSRWEEVEPAQAGRPRRRYYRLTEDGAASARSELAQLAELSREPVRGLRLRPAQGTT